MKVSICVITYNHEEYIRQCIEGVLMQRLNCTYEIVIGDDCSTDRTLEICENYAIEYSKVIRILPKQANLGMLNNWLRTISACKGDYIAICEGDDYWTDPQKLQKQLNLLEQHSDSVICFHPMLELFQNGDIQPQKESKFHVSLGSRKFLLNVNYISTLTVMFKKEALNFNDFNDFLAKYNPAMADYPLYIFLLSNPESSILFLEDYCGVYRSGRPESASNLTPALRFHLDFIRTLLYFRKYYNNLDNEEKASIYNAISREYMNLYKISMSKKKLLMPFLYFLSSNLNYFFYMFYRIDSNQHLYRYSSIRHDALRGLKLYFS